MFTFLENISFFIRVEGAERHVRPKLAATPS